MFDSFRVSCKFFQNSSVVIVPNLLNYLKYIFWFLKLVSANFKVNLYFTKSFILGKKKFKVNFYFSRKQKTKKVEKRKVNNKNKNASSRTKKAKKLITILIKNLFC